MEAKNKISKPITAPPALLYSPDVMARMKATGIDPVAAEKRLSVMPRDQAENTWANVMDYYRRSTDMASKVAAHQGADKTYLTERKRQPTNPAWTAFDDMGASYKNSLVDLTQGISDLVPSTVDLAMSAISNPSDNSWYRQWDKSTDDFFAKAKYYVSPEAQAAVYDEKTGLNWRAVAGMIGSTLGFLTTTMLPMIGAAGKGAEMLSGGSKILRTLTDPRLQSGAIGYLQALPGYKEAAIQAGYTRNQAALIAPVLSTAQAVLEFAGADALMKSVKLAPSEALHVVRQLGKESAADAFAQSAGKPLTEETFRDVINATGKGFFGRLRTPEIRNAILQNIKAGAASEGVEELLQQGAESAIQKMADTYYGYDAKGGKGFDPTLKDAAIQGVAGLIMGGAVGGSMGGMLGRTPTHVGQQTVWGMLDSNVRDLINKNPDLDLANNKDGLSVYRLADKLHGEGKLSDTEYASARQNLDRMTAVSARLARTKADTPTRYALFNLDSEQQQWAERQKTEVDAPMQRLTQLAQERAPGQWFPKPGLSTLDLAEAQELIHQDIPRKVELAKKINQSIEESVLDLMNPAKREAALRSYKPMLDGLADEWENGPKEPDPAQPLQPDQYSEGDVVGLERTMDTPDGRFALANGPDGRQVFRVENQTLHQQSDVSEEKDPVVGRFSRYTLPSKGQPVVSLHVIADQTRHNQLLDAFDTNSDVTEPYSDWRNRVADQYQDNELDGLRMAEARYQQEAAELPADAPDWQKQDLARKQAWLKSAMASRAADSTESRYGWSNWTSGYLAEPMQAAGITPEQMAALPDAVQSDVATALQAGDIETAKTLVNQPPTVDEPVSTTSRADELSAQIAATAARQQLVENVQRTSRKVLDLSKVIEELEQFAHAGEHDIDTEQRLIYEIAELERALDEEYDALGAYNSEFASRHGSPETGAGESETGSDRAAQDGQQSGGETASPENSNGSIADEGSGSNALASPPQKRDSSQVELKPIDRQPQDLREAILQFFASGNRIRRSDLAYYGDPNWNKGGKGGNPYLLYTTGDDKQVPLDIVARDIVVDRLGRREDDFDIKDVVQDIVDSVKSFSPVSTPRQQIIAHQQESVQMAIQEMDDQVEQATRKTPFEILIPLMDAMDQVQVPVIVQDQLINIIADNYLTPDGLDWVGVIHLFRHNQLFDEFSDLHRSLVPYMEAVVRQIPTTEAELASEAEHIADFMSDQWWNQTADEYQLSSEQYNQLIDDFYGEPTNSSGQSANEVPTGNRAIRSDEERSGLFSERNQPSGESREHATQDQPGSAIRLTFEQQARIDAVNAQADAEVNVLKNHNVRLNNQADTLRQSVRSRVKTGELFEATSPTTVSQSAPPLPGLPDGYLETATGLPSASVTPNTTLVIKRTNGGFQAWAADESILSARIGRLAQNRAYFIDPYFDKANSPDGAVTNLVTIIPAEFSADGTLLTRGRIFFETSSRKYGQSATNTQTDLIARQQTGIEVENAAKSKLEEIQRQIAANKDRIDNLEATRSKAIEVALSAPIQPALFQHSNDVPSIIDAEMRQNLITTLQATFDGVLDEVQLMDSTQMEQQIASSIGKPFRDNQGTTYGFVLGKTMYLNSEVMNANTPIHEFGHVWNAWAKASRPDLYATGIKKATKSPYFNAVSNDPFYQQQAERLGLDGDARTEFFAEEALASAIGDEGEKFIKKRAKTGFAVWLDQLWSAIKDKLGIESKSTKEISDMSLQDFAAGVAARLLEGRKLSIDEAINHDPIARFSYGPPPTPQDQPARPLLNQGAAALASLAENFKSKTRFRQSLLAMSAPRLADYFRDTFEPMAQAILRHAADSKVANQLIKLRANGQTLADPTTGDLNPDILKALAMELVSNKPKGSEATGRLRDLLWAGTDGAEPSLLTAYRDTLIQKAFIDENGDYEWPDLAENQRDLLASLDAYAPNANDPAVVQMQKKLLTTKFLSNVLNSETVGKLFSLGENSMLRRITKDIRRAWVSRAAEVRLRRNHSLNTLSEKLVGLSHFATPLGTIGDSGAVKTYSLTGWEGGVATTLNLPVSDWMDLYLTAKTQLTTSARKNPDEPVSSVIASVDASGKLIATRQGVGRDNAIKTGSYGYQYTAPGAERPTTLLIDNATYLQLEQQLRAEHGDILDVVDQLFSDPIAKSYLTGLYETETGLPFPIESEAYYPTQAWQSAAGRDSIPTIGSTLENARILSERKTPPLKVVGRDLLARVNSYVNIENRYIANSATRLNLIKWRIANADSLDKAPTWLTDYLDKLEKDLNDGGANSPDESSFEFELGGVDLGLRAWIKRFSRSTFAFNLTTPLKQITTYLNAFGMGIVENQYLRQASADLGKLAVNSYNLAKENDEKSAFGSMLAEKPYLDEMASNPYMATVLDRLVSADEAYLGRPTLDDLKANPTESTVALARKAAHTVSSYGLGWVRRADRATILSFWKASQYQVADKIAAVILVDETGRLVTSTSSDAALREVARLTTELTYATNTMSGEGDATPLQRNKGLAGAMLGLYSGQQQRLLNTVVQSVNDYLKARSIGDPSVDELRERAAWAATNLLLFNSLAVSLVNLFYRALSALLTGKEPKEDQLISLAWDTSRGLLGTVPSVPTELILAASTWVDGPQWGEDVMGYAPSAAMQSTVEGLKAGVEYLSTDDPKMADKRWNALTYGLSDGATKLSGLPSALPRLIQKITKEEPVQESDWLGI